MLSLEELRASVEAGTIDTVVTAFTDMQGRLVGKRVHGEYFVEHVAAQGLEACDYLLAVDMEMDPVPGYRISNWDRGYGDFHMLPDLTTLRRVPWLEGTALVLCDLEWDDGSPVRPSPRQVLRAQVERAAALGVTPMIGSELEFYLFAESYEEARAKGFEGLTPSVPYILDYHVLATTFDEPLVRRIRNGMHAAGIPVEFSKGEAWGGQHEINFRYADAVTTADRHTIYKNGAKEIAHLCGRSLTFMAKPDRDWIGNSCHVHASLWHGDESAFAGHSETFGRFLAGLVAGARELALFLAPTVNSYKRFAAGSWAPTTIAWGEDNRTCGFRIVGHGPALRVECRIPGGDVNPYLAFAALLAAGLHGIERELVPPPPLEGNAYASEAERFPSSLREALDCLERGAIARDAFGEDVVDHYLNYGRAEQRLFDEVVTSYERRRMFERG